MVIFVDKTLGLLDNNDFEIMLIIIFKTLSIQLFIIVGRE